MRASIIAFCFALVALTFAGCSALPSWRIFQKKIDPKLVEKPDKQVEAERQAAKYIVLKSAAPFGNPVTQLEEIHSVAVPLSASLGEPAQVIVVQDKDSIIAALHAGMIAEQKKTEAWKAFATKYAGKEIEGTGVDLAPWGGGLGLIGLLAACILVPGFGTLVLFVIKRLRGTVQQISQGVEEYAAANPAAAADLKQKLRGTMDLAHQAIVDREKKFIDWVKVEKAKLTGSSAKPVVPTP